MRVLPYGERALLLETDDTDSALALYQALRDDPADGVCDLVPAARTVLVQLTAAADRARVADDIAARPVLAVAPLDGPLVVIPTTYDGADLSAVADLAGLSVEEVIRRHQEAEYRVAFCGFAPGFAYLRGLDRILQVPRLDSPRTLVPAGAVAIAGEYSAVYPRRSPGGWRLLGHTALQMWRTDRDPPALLVPGARVRFETT